MKRTLSLDSPPRHIMSKYKHLLLVEDEEGDREFFLHALEKTAPETVCHVATDGRDAVKMLPRLTMPELIFLDLHMPRMSGYEFLEWIKADEKYSKIPVVVLSSTISEVERCMELGAALVFGKPSSPQTLQTILSTVMNFDVTKDGSMLQSLVSYKMRYE